MLQPFRFSNHLKSCLAMLITSCLMSGCQIAVQEWQPNPEQVERMANSGQDITYDESRVPPYKLPDPLVSENGEPIETVDDWSAKRRPELLQLFRDHMYGNRPHAEHDVDYSVVSERHNAFGVGATASHVRAAVRAGDKTHGFDFTLVTPALDQPVPLIILINNRYPVPLERAVSEQDPFWPVEMLVRRGYATACFHTSDVEPDQSDGDALERLASLSFTCCTHKT